MQDEIEIVLGWLGYSTQHFVDATRGAADVKEAQARVDALKVEVRKAARRLWRELHPDVANVPGAQERLSRLTRALKVVDTFKATPRVAAPPIYVRVPVGRVDIPVTVWWGTGSEWPW